MFESSVNNLPKLVLENLSLFKKREDSNNSEPVSTLSFEKKVPEGGKISFKK